MPEVRFLSDTAVILGAAVAAAWLFRLMRAPTTLGFMVTGVLIGPSVLGFIRHDEVKAFAEVGLALLLFTVGVELSPAPLLRSGRRLLVAALVQMLGTALIGAIIIRWQLPVTTGGAVLIGMVVAISSSAIILGYLSQSGQTDTITGTISTAICVAQDFAVIAILLLLPLLSLTSEGTLREVLIRAGVSVGGLALIVWASRRLLPYILDRVLARGGRELMTLLAVAVACAGAWMADLAGWSWALGAFIAGLLISETDIRHQLIADITPFRDVFNALFFIALGMLVDFQAVSGHTGELVLAIAATLVLKSLVGACAVVIAGWPVRLGIHVGLMLPTVSEFGYVLASDAGRMGFLPQEFIPYIVAYAVGTMVAGAAIVPIAGRAANVLAIGILPRLRQHGEGESHAPRSPLNGHVIVVGSGFTGQNLVRVLGATHVPHVVVEMNRSLARTAKKAGAHVVLGDATRLEILKRAGIETARALVIVINDRQATQHIVAQAHAARPDLYILARTHYIGELDVLSGLGARQVISEEFESAIEIFAHVLHEFAIPDNIVQAEIMYVRSGRYAMLRGSGAAAPPDLMRLLERAATQTYYLDEGTPAVGRTLREINLRAASGATVIAVVRGGQPVTNPPPDFRFEPGDVLVLVGTHRQVEAAKALLSGTAVPVTRPE